MSNSNAAVVKVIKMELVTKSKCIKHTPNIVYTEYKPTTCSRK